ncbi:hypothetical protein VB779_22770 [Haloarculaceae archaeon H-GB11]|nr:hypothetical protein [Haloarculaceae archaeon H-GB11]
MTFRNCLMKNWGKEGLYASPHSGPIRVLGGEYANNAIVQVRVGSGHAPTRAIVRDVDIRVTKLHSYISDKHDLLRGIWLKEGDRALVENCRVILRNVDPKKTPGASSSISSSGARPSGTVTSRRTSPVRESWWRSPPTSTTRSGCRRWSISRHTGTSSSRT